MPTAGSLSFGTPDRVTAPSRDDAARPTRPRLRRWLPLLLTIALPLGACGGERAAQPVEAPSSAATAGTAPPPASPVPATGPQKVTPGPDVTVLPDGSAVLGPRVGDVAMLRRMPDGTFKRVCGPPDPETRDMLQGMMRARRRAK